MLQPGDFLLISSSMAVCHGDFVQVAWTCTFTGSANVVGYTLPWQGTSTCVDLWLVLGAADFISIRISTTFPGMPRNLGEDMCAFIMWVSFPKRNFGTQVPGMATSCSQGTTVRGTDNLLNYSFSPRSGFLITFRLSTRQQQGLPNFNFSAMTTTLGMQLHPTFAVLADLEPSVRGLFSLP